MKFSRNPIDETISEIRLAAEERELERRANLEGISPLTGDTPVDRGAIHEIPEEVSKSSGVAAINIDDNKITLAVISSRNKEVRELVDSFKGRGLGVDLFMVSQEQLRKIQGLYREVAPGSVQGGGRRGDIVSEISLNKGEINLMRSGVKDINGAIKTLKKVNKDMPTSEVLKMILATSLILRASDVHIEHITKEDIRLRVRIDGALRDMAEIDPATTRQLTNRIKLLAKLKLNITDEPQDGRFTIAGGGGDVEVRVSVVPAEFGEAIVLRVLDPMAISMDLHSLGLREDDETVVIRKLKQPNGMILTTGPTGSGKTTTLYAFIKKVKTPEIKIITIEDPIEYHIEGIEQTQVNTKDNFTFSTGLKSILRQDPDVILIGEIRDLETAEVGVHAALTGHLVFSALHTNNAAGAIPRLIDLGVKPNVIGPALSLIVAQRLVRRLCGKCSKEAKMDPEMKTKVDKFIKNLPKRVSRESIGEKIYDAVGCENCIGGYIGRIAIVELLEVSEEINSLIHKNATERDIREAAIKEQGMVLMQQDGILKALQGITTLDEIERETGPIQW